MSFVPKILFAAAVAVFTASCRDSETQTAKNIIARHKGTPIMWLPKEGKKIDVECVQWIGSDDEDFRYDMFQLEWTGNSFKESKK